MKKISLFLGILLPIIGLLLFYFYFGLQKVNRLVLPMTRPNPWTLLLVGDIQLSREVAAQIDKYGPDYPFENIEELTNSTSLTVGNLESPFFEGEANTSAGTMVFGAETKAIEGLKNAGFDLVNLANNHFSNQGKAGMNYTFDLLNQYGIGYFGAGTNETKAHAPAIKTVNGIEIAFLGYSDRDVLPGNSIAISDTPGLAPMDIDQAKIDILNAKKIADLVMVSMHSGTEYTPFSNNKQISFARSAIDAGANLVFGHHPHVVQGYEHYKGKLIIYSLGNFIFDQAWSKETQQGLATKLTFEGENLVTMNLIPLRIKNWCQPTPLESGTEYDEILRRINLGSEKLKP